MDAADQREVVAATDGSASTTPEPPVAHCQLQRHGPCERSAPKDARSLRETITADQGNRGCRAQPWEARYVRAENGSQVEGGSTEGAHGRTRPDASPIEQTKATPT